MSEIARSLFAAANRKDIALVKELLKKASATDVNFVEHHWTALMMAAGDGHTEIVELLLTHPGINVNLQHKGGGSAFMQAAARRQIPTMRAILSHHNVDPNLRYQDGTTALIEACEMGHTETVSTILTHSMVQTSIIDKEGKKAADYAQKEKIKALILSYERDGPIVSLRPYYTTTALPTADPAVLVQQATADDINRGLIHENEALKSTITSLQEEVVGLQYDLHNLRETVMFQKNALDARTTSASHTHT